MTGYTKTNPGLPPMPCMSEEAHGPHRHNDWPNDPREYWCDGIRAHVNTMIGQRCE